MDSIFTNLLCAGILAFAGFLWRRMTCYKESQQSLENGLRALLKDRIISIHEEATQAGYITYAELERAQYIYNAYHGLGGNGTGTALMADLKGMKKCE